jgi:tetratricopeptide (TPR) repeat protein
MGPARWRPLSILLGSLELAQLIRKSAPEPELEYLFKHGLVQESAYDSLLRTDRRHLHRLVAETLEGGPEPLGQSALRLAQHWDHAGESRRAFDSYVRAGNQASQVYANTEALMAYDRAYALAKELALSAAQRLSLYVARGRVLEHNGAYAEAIANYQSLEQLAQAEGDRATELQVLIHRTTLLATPNVSSDWKEAERLSLQALDMARVRGDRPAEAKVLWNLLLRHFSAGHNVDAVAYGEAAVTIARELDLREQLAYILNDLARPLLIIGRVAEAQAALVESQSLWRELENLPMLADNLISTGMFSYFIGNYQAHQKDLEEGLRISEELGNLWGQAYGHETMGLLYAQTGEASRALKHLSAAAEFGAQVNYLYPQYEGLAVVATLYELLGALDKARNLLDTLLAKPETQPEWLTLPRITLARLDAHAGNFEGARAALDQAEAALAGTMGGIGLILFHFSKTFVLLAQSQPEAALAQSRLGLEELSKTGVRPFRDALLYHQALAMEQLGAWDDALSAAQAARREAEETGGRAWLWEIFAALARLYVARGEIDLAREMNQQALAQVRFIADHAPPELHDSIWKRAELVLGNAGIEFGGPVA